MKVMVFLGFVLASIGISTSASSSGGMGSGGGNAVVCLDDQGQIESATLLDLFEGRAAFGDVHAPVPEQTMESYLDAAKSRLANTGYGLLIPYLPSLPEAIDHIRMTLRFLADDAEFDTINDSFHFVIPVGCIVAQAAYFIDRENITVNRKIWEAFSHLDRAGLILHEAVYWLDRQVKQEQDSRRARRVVSQALEQEWGFEDVKDGLPESYILCYPMDPGVGVTVRPTVFAAYPQGSFQVLQFLAINGDLLLSKTTSAVLSDFPLFDPADPTGSYGSQVVTKSRYENEHALYLRRYPVVDSAGEVIFSTLEIEGRKATYPEWQMDSRQLSCFEFNR